MGHDKHKHADGDCCGPSWREAKRNPARMAVKILAGVVFGGLLALGFGWVVMALWNQILPGVTGWAPLTFWKALGLLILCRILFGGHMRHHLHRKGRHHRDRHRPHGHACCGGQERQPADERTEDPA